MVQKTLMMIGWRWLSCDKCNFKRYFWTSYQVHKYIFNSINLLISTMLPNFNTMIGYVTSFFDTALTYIGFIMDSLFISSEVISFIILFYTF